MRVLQCVKGCARACNVFILLLSGNIARYCNWIERPLTANLRYLSTKLAFFYEQLLDSKWQSCYRRQHQGLWVNAIVEESAFNEQENYVVSADFNSCRFSEWLSGHYNFQLSYTISYSKSQLRLFGEWAAGASPTLQDRRLAVRCSVQNDHSQAQNCAKLVSGTYNVSALSTFELEVLSNFMAFFVLHQRTFCSRHVRTRKAFKWSVFPTPFHFNVSHSWQLVLQRLLILYRMISGRYCPSRTNSMDAKKRAGINHMCYAHSLACVCVSAMRQMSVP